jgi:hypothetical protein
MLEVIENYLLLKKQIAQLIKKSGYRNEFIASKIGMRADYKIIYFIFPIINIMLNRRTTSEFNS